MSDAWIKRIQNAIMGFVYIAGLVEAFWIGSKFGQGDSETRHLISKKVVGAFGGVAWSKHSFDCIGFPMTAGDEKYFYEVGEVNGSLKRLNEVLNELNKD